MYVMAFTYISPYVRKYWSKRLWYDRPTSIRCKLRAMSRPKKRLPAFIVKDQQWIKRRPYRKPERTNYALHKTSAENILKPKYAHL